MNNKDLSDPESSPGKGTVVSNNKRRIRNGVFLILVLPGLFFGMGCKSKKAISVAPTPREMIKPTSSELLIRKINSNENTFSYYAAKGEASVKDLTTDQSFDISIVMEKDQYIWMNITALFGIEAARIKITADSVVILDRLHHKCIITDFSYLKKIANVDLKLKQLQQIIIGNPAFDNDEKQSIVDTVLSNIIIYTIINSQKQTAFYDNTFKLSKNSIEEKNMNRQFTVEYSNPYVHENDAYPSVVNINIRGEKNVACKFRLSNFVFEKKKETLFSIPGNYEIIKP